MQNVGWVSHVSLRPVRDVLSEAAPNLGVEPHHIVLAQRFQASVGPVAHRHHDRFLIHLEFASFGEMKAAFPSIAKAIWPFSGIAIALVPDIFVSP